MKQIDLREGARRQHRTVALFAVIQCWIRNLDGVCFQRTHLQRLVGLERFKGTRVDWLKADLAECFPYQSLFVFGESFASLFVSRRPLEPFLPTGTMLDSDRIKKMSKRGPKIEIFSLWPRLAWHEGERLKDGFEGIAPLLVYPANFDERVMASYLALIAQGQMSPKKLIESFLANKA
jgi:hypothetical protein